MILLSSNVYVNIIVPAFVLIPLVICIREYYDLQTKYKYFIYYTIVNTAGNLFAVILALKHNNNMPLLHVYTVCEFATISLIYKKIFENNIYSIIINILIILFSIFAFINAYYLQNIYVFNTYVRSIESIIIILYSLIYFIKTLDHSNSIYKTKNAFLYVNSGFLLYFGGSFFLFLTANLVQGNLFLYSAFWTGHATLVLIMYILFTIGLLHVKKLR